MEPLVGRLRALIDALGVGVDEFAVAIGQKPHRLRDILRGKTRMPGDLIQEIPKAFYLRDEWWLRGDGEMFNADKARVERDGLVLGPKRVPVFRAARKEDRASDFDLEYVRVPRYQVGAGAGGGLAVESEQIVDYLAFKRDWFSKIIGIAPASAALIEVRGDSMTPVLLDGELVIVDTSCDAFKDDAIYVLQYSGALRIKNVRRRLDGKIEIKSANEGYGLELLTEQEAEAGTITIVGRARWALSGRRLP